MDIDMERFVLIIVAVFFILGLVERFKIGSWILQALGRPRLPQQENEVDILGEVIKRNKQVAKDCKREHGFGKYLLYTGDASVPGKRGKYVGVLPTTSCHMYYIKSSVFGQSRPFVIPAVLCTDLQRRYIRLKCRNYRPYGKQFMIPVFTEDVSVEKREEYIKLIDHFIYELCNREINIEVQSLRMNAVATNSKTDHYSERLLAFRGKNRGGEDELIDESEED